MIKIRASYLSSYTDCPRRNAAKMFKGIIEESGINFSSVKKQVGAAIGTGVHTGAKYLMKEKLMGEMCKLDHIVEISTETYRSEIEEGILYDTISPSNNVAEGQIKAISRAYFHLVAPNIKPVDVEKEFTATIGDNYTIIGHPDIVSYSGINDLKTGGGNLRTYYEQMGAYLLLVKSNQKSSQDKKLIINWVPRVPKNKPAAVPVEIEYNSSLCEKSAYSIIKRIIFDFNNYLENKDPECFPTNFMSILCSPKYCIAHGTNFCELSK